ncbi:MAG TPA: VOC family protein [Chloroflexota bacterium]|nr:VOC family protein [Chloroflexota bacterium]HEX2988507.1 VOC family protein [Chloroflexota bacterium]
MAGTIDYTLEHLHVYCSDMAASERWFVSGMGAELVRHLEIKGFPATELRIGGARLLLRGQRQGEVLGPGGTGRCGWDHLGLLVKDMDATVAELKRRGVEFEMEPQPLDATTRMAFVRGPDALRIELLERS